VSAAPKARPEPALDPRRIREALATLPNPGDKSFPDVMRFYLKEPPMRLFFGQWRGAALPVYEAHRAIMRQDVTGTSVYVWNCRGVTYPTFDQENNEH
jgi:hypothetical protein